jgi:hypothetical protein
MLSTVLAAKILPLLESFMQTKSEVRDRRNSITSRQCPQVGVGAFHSKSLPDDSERTLLQPGTKACRLKHYI